MTTINSISQRTEELTGVKSGAEIISKYDTDAANAICCASNRMYVKLNSVSNTTTTLFTNCIPLKAPCTYVLVVKLSCMSDTAQWVYWVPWRITQIVSGGAVTAVSGTALIDDGPGVHAISFAKNATRDTLDMLVDSNIGGTQFSITAGAEIFCNKNF